MSALRTVCRAGHPLEGDNLYVVQGRRRCRVCQAAKIKKWRFEHRDDPAYKAARNASSMGSYRRCKEKRSAYARQVRVGITPEQYAQKLVDQAGLCAICRRSSAAVADHDHSNGQVRDLLCNRCNLILGYIEKTPEIIAGVAAYLQRWKA